MKKLLICLSLSLMLVMGTVVVLGNQDNKEGDTVTTQPTTEESTEDTKSSAAEITEISIVTVNYEVQGKIDSANSKITFTIPYGYTDQNVTVNYKTSEKATVTKESIQNKDTGVNLKSKNTITVIAENETTKTWKLESSVETRIDPTVTMDFDNITTSRATVSVSVAQGNEAIKKMVLRYYASETSKTNAKSKTFTDKGADISLTGLSSNTKYYVYVEITMNNSRVYTSTNKTFTTKKSSSSSSSSGSSSSSTGTGLVTSGSGVRYRENTYITSTWKQILGSWYYFGEDGYAVNGWLKQNDIWYYFDNNRMVSSDWRRVNNVWYYFYSDGRMAEKEWVTSNGKKYYLNPGGAMVANDWVLLDGKWYFLDSSGAMLQNTFLEYKGNRYWLRKDSGILATSERINVNEIWYNVNQDGVAVRIQ